MYKPSEFSPKFSCTVNFTSNTPIVLITTLSDVTLPTDGGYVLFESSDGNECVFEYTSAINAPNAITISTTASTWLESKYYTNPSNEGTLTGVVSGTISRTFTALDWWDVINHVEDMNNPHGTTKDLVGLGNADNTSDINKPVSTAQRAAIDLVQANLDAHEADTNNPHQTTKADVGLGNADNTSDLNKPISTATQTALNGKVDDSQIVSTAPKSPAITASGGTSSNIPRVDHVHPSETFSLSNVSASSWVADTDYPDYGYACTITNANITANHTPIVIFSDDDAKLNKFARVASTSAGAVKIYARVVPESTITIPTIIFVRKI